MIYLFLKTRPDVHDPMGDSERLAERQQPLVKDQCIAGALLHTHSCCTSVCVWSITIQWWNIHVLHFIIPERGLIVFWRYANTPVQLLWLIVLAPLL